MVIEIKIPAESGWPLPRMEGGLYMGSKEVESALRNLSVQNTERGDLRRVEPKLLSSKPPPGGTPDMLHPRRQAIGGAFIYHSPWAGLLDGGVLVLDRVGTHNSESGDIRQPLCAAWNASSYMDSLQHNGRISMMQSIFYALHRSKHEELPRWITLRLKAGHMRHSMTEVDKVPQEQMGHGCGLTDDHSCAVWCGAPAWCRRVPRQNAQNKCLLYMQE